MAIDVGLATLVLAFFTMLAVVVPVVSERRKKREERRAAVRLVRHTIGEFLQRTGELVNDINVNAEALLRGLDVPLSQALSHDVWRAIPSNPLTTDAHVVLMQAYASLARSAEMQRLGDRVSAQDEASKSYVKIDDVHIRLHFYLEHLDERCKPWYIQLRNWSMQSYVNIETRIRMELNTRAALRRLAKRQKDAGDP